jgi:hypothetical protein
VEHGRARRDAFDLTVLAVLRAHGRQYVVEVAGRLGLDHRRGMVKCSLDRLVAARLARTRLADSPTSGLGRRYYRAAVTP